MKDMMLLRYKSFLLSFDTDGSSSTSGSFSVLTSDSESPFVSKTTVGSHLEKSFNIFSEFGFEDVGSHLEILSLFVITDSVKEPSGDTVSFRVVDDVGNSIALLFRKLTSSDARIDSQDLAD